MKQTLKQMFEDAVKEGWFKSIENIQECFGYIYEFETNFRCDECPLNVECEKESEKICEENLRG